MAEDLALDLEELHHLQSIAKRPRIISLLSSEINNLEKLTKETPSAPPPQVPTPISTGTKVPSIPALKYATLSSFSWDQDNDKVKIYVSLEGVQENKIESEFKPMSFDLKFHDIQGKNYQLAIPKPIPTPTPSSSSGFPLHPLAPRSTPPSDSSLATTTTTYSDPSSSRPGLPSSTLTPLCLVPAKPFYCEFLLESPGLPESELSLAPVINSLAPRLGPTHLALPSLYFLVYLDDNIFSLSLVANR